MGDDLMYAFALYNDGACPTCGTANGIHRVVTDPDGAARACSGGDARALAREALDLRAKLAKAEIERDAAIARAEKIEQERDEVLDGCEKVSGAELLQSGGAWLGAARNWCLRAWWLAETRRGER